MVMSDMDKLEETRKLMHEFSRRTGLTGTEGDINRRYLWTDAFAVQNFFGLAHACKDESFKDKAIYLIDIVHEKLGRYHPEDDRKGWISGLPEDEGRNRPTAGGLRIGKHLPERREGEPFNERLEWERDGQYFHYLTRWINTLLKAEQETGKSKYLNWAADLLKAGGRFIDISNGRVRMYWKMSVDLSRPLITSMGAHDPLEGLICAKSIIDEAPEKEPELRRVFNKLEQLCEGLNWSTSDDLGIGGLLLNAVRVSEMDQEKDEFPEKLMPENLFADSLEGMKMYVRRFDKNRPANQRLAFRECGFSLGLRALAGLKERPKYTTKIYNELYTFLPLAEEIEDFWRNPRSRQSLTWTDHLDINEVSLASSMVAKYYPYAFSHVRNEKQQGPK